ncbi:GNAT family N-acetyltransferase [Salinispora cortesiana]|uniref:GNAT family N-acetyltransferase n=1 Tax=Salinispora cortesiana TaxID=1305843 RepID=UPI000428A236|nr:GNAT family N-acetyltransferase [Salinispora cortesiana]
MTRWGRQTLVADRPTCQAGRGLAGPFTLDLRDGTELDVRSAVGDDLPGVVDLHERCSARSRNRRYHGGSARLAPARMRRLLEPARGVTLLATPTASHSPSAPVVAMANLLGEGDTAEVALLVRDDWQRRGLGSVLLRRLVWEAEQSGYVALDLHVQAENTPMLRVVYRLARPSMVDRDGSLLTLTVPLTAADSPARAPLDLSVPTR